MDFSPEIAFSVLHSSTSVTKWSKIIYNCRTWARSILARLVKCAPQDQSDFAFRILACRSLIGAVRACLISTNSAKRWEALHLYTDSLAARLHLEELWRYTRYPLAFLLYWMFCYYFVDASPYKYAGLVVLAIGSCLLFKFVLSIVEQLLYAYGRTSSNTHEWKYRSGQSAGPASRMDVFDRGHRNWPWDKIVAVSINGSRMVLLLVSSIGCVYYLCVNNNIFDLGLNRLGIVISLLMSMIVNYFLTWRVFIEGESRSIQVFGSWVMKKARWR
jgi:hypothetical protein